MSDDPRAPDADRPTTAWRFGSPSALLLALLMLPLPWLEVRCGPQPGHTSPTHYTQTGVQLLCNRCTDLTGPTPAAGSADRPLRTFVGWWWLLVVVAAVALGFFGGRFVPSLLNLMLSWISAGLFLLLLGVIFFVEELFRGKAFYPAVFVTLTACVAAAASSTVAFTRMNRSSPVVDP